MLRIVSGMQMYESVMDNQLLVSLTMSHVGNCLIKHHVMQIRYVNGEMMGLEDLDVKRCSSDV